MSRGKNHPTFNYLAKETAGEGSIGISSTVYSLCGREASDLGLDAMRRV